MKDPFEAAAEGQDSPPESPAPHKEEDASAATEPAGYDGGAPSRALPPPRHPSSSAAAWAPAPLSAAAARVGEQAQKEQEDDDDDEEDHVEVDLEKLPSGTGDPDKLARMNAILSQFNEEQMNRYESFRRSGFQKSNMRRILASITGSQKISIPTTIVVSGIAKMFVGELIETARVVMTERKDSGPIRPCHIREAYRRLKLEGKIPRRSVPRLFR